VKRALLLALAGSSLATGIALARPVPVGRFVEIPYGVSARHPWRTGGGDRGRSSLSSATAPTRAPEKQWEARIGVGRVFPPAVAEDGTLFVGSQAGVAAVAPEGTVRWALRLGLVSGTPSLTPEGYVAIGAQPGELMVIGGARSQTTARIGGGVRGAPLVLDDGSMVVAAYDQAVHRFDAEGRRMFRTSVPTHVRGAPALTREGEVVVPAGPDLLWMSVRGRVLRSVPLGAEAALGPAVGVDGAVWILTTEGTLLGFAGASGRVVARSELGVRPSMDSNLAIARDGSVRFGTADAGVVCVGPTGTERWRFENGTYGGGISVDRTGATLAVSQTGVMVLLDARGSPVWTAEIGTRTDAAPVLGADGTVYVATFGGTLQAWR